MQLNGAVALVTGGASGIGEATTARLQEAGARVAVLDVQPSESADLMIKCDVGDEAEVVGAVDRVTAEFGAPDVALLAAGIGGSSPLLQMRTEEWDRVHRVNLRGLFMCLRETAKAMVAATKPGCIVAVGSVSGITSDRYLAHYATTKAAVHQLVRVAAGELGPHGVRVNAIAPGCTDTPMFSAVDNMMPAYRELMSKKTALGRIGTSDDIAEAILALMRLDWVTGAVLTADGGITLRSPLDPADELGV